MIRSARRLCPDRKSGLFGGSEDIHQEEPFRNELALQVRHTVIRDRERLLGSPPFGSLSSERCIEGLTGECLFLRRSSQVNTEGVVGLH